MQHITINLSILFTEIKENYFCILYFIFFRSKKELRLWVDEEEEKIPLVNGDKRIKRA